MENYLRPNRKISTGSAFDSFGERVNLILPLLFLFVAVVIGLLGISFTSRQRHGLSFLESIVFLNTLHVPFTFLTLCFVPECRAWLRSRRARDRLTMVKIFAVFLGGFTFYTWVHRQRHSNHDLFTVAMWLPMVWGVQHSLGQAFGISMLYNCKARLVSRGRTEALVKIESIERKAYRVLFLATILYAMIDSLQWSSAFELQGGLLLVANGAAILLVLNGLRFPRARVSGKALYMLRFLLYPLGLQSIVALAGYESAHGVEYFFVIRQMLKNSVSRGQVGRGAIFFCGLFLFIFAAVALTQPVALAWLIRPRLPSFATVFAITGPLYGASAFTHYYLDRILFRMRDESTRLSIGPLLLGRSAGTGTGTGEDAGAGKGKGKGTETFVRSPAESDPLRWDAAL